MYSISCQLKQSGRRQAANLSETPVPDGISVADFQCKNCITDQFGDPRPIVAMYMSGGGMCENFVAAQKLEKMGLTLDACNYRRTAVPECFVAENWNTGWVCKVMHEIFRDMGAVIIAKTKANTTVTSSVYSGPSSYTRCVYEIQLKQVDICVGDFWETEQRRAISAFTSALDLDTMKLTSMPKGGKSFVLRQSPWFDDNSLLWTWAEPFTWEVWLTYFGMTIFAAGMLCMVEMGYYHWHEPGAKYHQGHWAVPYKAFQALLGALHRPPLRVGTYKDNRFEHAVSWAGRIVISGYGMLVFLFSTNYLAQVMKVYSQGGRVPGLQTTTFAGVPEAGGKICMLDALYETVAAKLPAENAFKLDVYGPVFEHLYQGRCSAAIVGKNEYLGFALQAKQSFTVCDREDDPYGYATCADLTKKATDIVVVPSPEACTPKESPGPDPDGPPVIKECDPSMVRRYCPIREVLDPDFFLEVSFALPVTDWAEPYVSAWITARKFSGAIKNSRGQFLGDISTSVCEEVVASKMKMSQIYGITIFSSALMLLGVMITFGLQCVHSLSKRIHQRQADSARQAGVPLGDLGYLEKDNDIDLYAKSVEIGAAHLRCNGPDPGNVKMQQKVDKLRSLCDGTMAKLQDIAQAHSEREQAHAAEKAVLAQAAVRPERPPSDPHWSEALGLGFFGDAGGGGGGTDAGGSSGSRSSTHEVAT